MSNLLSTTEARRRLLAGLPITICQRSNPGDRMPDGVTVRHGRTQAWVYGTFVLASPNGTVLAAPAGDSRQAWRVVGSLDAGYAAPVEQARQEGERDALHLLLDLCGTEMGACRMLPDGWMLLRPTLCSNGCQRMLTTPDSILSGEGPYCGGRAQEARARNEAKRKLARNLTLAEMAERIRARNEAR